MWSPGGRKERAVATRGEAATRLAALLTALLAQQAAAHRESGQTGE